ncbi:MAG: HypC/HybG/HupF family hydrogenase formation chaperone [Candidatus Caldatribacteriota bacterium]|jgi:hydrogenase expression/formation protein HypC|nr:HypC/HybG/HupF family hydrogenase formation chaperone [Atribacterota bacterium]MDD3031490.1 HypC/HybG/HupF family hydrogenase formation chaperone [Atribacterota bacterium]MDD3640846.1 HypC/HybG/HupF family hydrogenase formation chaperone [Atribacterota bacterium]MDD4288361.1 HypC/HybG/HupF family hydrogenase formation chaperone [Atribacterota bacterium]MDD4764682.1 HypC/HybG/HupF family hydrogenase formation chaperone [Atribacterota bacterium]
MCLAVPGKAVRIIDSKQVEVLVGNIKKIIRTDLLPEIEEGDYLLIHAGYAITKINQKEADEVSRAWEEVQY